MATVIGASCAYATPVGIPASVMVFSIGGYRFTDYTRAGLPLILVATVVSLILLPIFSRFFHNEYHRDNKISDLSYAQVLCKGG